MAGVIGVLVIIWVLSGIISEAFEECSDGRFHYAPENTCIFLVEEIVTWNDAKDYCQEEWYELVQIWNEEKNKFVKDHIPAVENGFWIGVSDTDSDGTFEYINGTKLRNERPGLGTFQKTGGANDADAEAFVGKCGMVLTGAEGGWVEEDCTAKHQFVCEEPLDFGEWGQKEGKHTKCTFVECICYGHDWYELVNTNTYVLIHRVAANQWTSEQMCHKLGGSLIKITNEEMAMAMKGLIQWNPVGTYHWVGLTHDLDSKSWVWGDGSVLTRVVLTMICRNDDKLPLKHTRYVMTLFIVLASPGALYTQRSIHTMEYICCKHTLTKWPDINNLCLTTRKQEDRDYQHWYGYKAQDFSCVAVIWDYNALWRVTACHQENFHVCQALAPCASNPSIVIPESRPLKDRTGNVLSVKNKRTVNIKCFLYGYTRSVTKVELECEGSKLRNIGTRQTSVARLLTVNLMMHGNKCVCESFKHDGPSDKSQIIIDVESHPFLTVGKATLKKFLLPKRGNFTLTLSIAANPKPESLGVIENAVELGGSNYSVRIKPRDKKLHYSVTLDLFHYRVGRVYSFVIDNGLEKKLDYKFVFAARAQAGVGFADVFAINGIIILVITSLLLTGLIIVTFQATRGKKDTTESGESGDGDDSDQVDDAVVNNREGSDTLGEPRLEPIMHPGRTSETIRKSILWGDGVRVETEV